MILVLWEAETEERGRVTTLHYKPEELPQETLDAGLLVEEIPEPPAAELGKYGALFINPQTAELFYEMFDRPLNDQEKLQQLQEEKAALEQKLAQLNGDFAAFTDFYFEKNPEQA